MADRAARGCARYAVVAGNVADDAAHDRAFSAAFGVCSGVGERERCGKGEGSECSFQLRLLF